MARKRNGNVAILPVSVEVSLGALANEAVASASLFGSSIVLEHEAFVIHADLYWSKRNGTAGEGPIGVGLSHNDLSDTLVAQGLTAHPIEPDDIQEMEQASRRRWIKKSAMFSGIAAEEVVNDGKSIRTKIMMPVSKGKSIDIYAFNQSGATLTTGATVEVFGEVTLRWT